MSDGGVFGWLVGWLVGGWIGWLVGGLRDGVVVCMSVERFRVWLVDWVVEILKGGRFICWEIGGGWLIGWLVDRLVYRGQGGALVGQLID